MTQALKSVQEHHKEGIMLGQTFYGILSILFGVLYPAFKSFKAIREKNPRSYVYWMMFWICASFFRIIEPLTNILFGFWCPFYEEIKLGILFWLINERAQGAAIIYRRFLHPKLCKYEPEINHFVNNFQSETFRLLLAIFSKGIWFAGRIIGSTAGPDLIDSPRMNLRLIQELAETTLPGLARNALRDVHRDENNNRNNHENPIIDTNDTPYNTPPQSPSQSSMNISEVMDITEEEDELEEGIGDRSNNPVHSSNSKSFPMKVLSAFMKFK